MRVLAISNHTPGLSPRMRGSPIGIGQLKGVVGPIPADAGEPDADGKRVLDSRAYPRGCGGADLIADELGEVRGLSPRMRGSHGQGDGRPRRQGPIPADAGEPPWRAAPAARPRAYPRGCGGAGARPEPGSCPGGLSPRMRGSLAETLNPSIETGLIPADAGEPCCASIGSGMSRAYPRGCGGARMKSKNTFDNPGLSPRMRGSLGLKARRPASTGPIPADAGEPKYSLTFNVLARAYPRGCGGAAIVVAQAITPMGLSPRMRGSHAGSDAVAAVAGPIPADAGEP